MIIIGQYFSYGYFLTQIFSYKFPLTSLFLSVILTTLVLMIFWSYSFAVFKDPGYLPLMQDENIEISENDIEEAKEKSFKMKEKVSFYLTKKYFLKIIFR